MHREAIAQSTANFYTQKLLHKRVFTQKAIYTRKTFTQSSFYTKQLLHTANFDTKKPLHRSFYTQML